VLNLKQEPHNLSFFIYSKVAAPKLIARNTSGTLPVAFKAR